MPMTDAESIREVLRMAVVRAMKQRDREALGVYRSALAAIDNAEAVPLGTADRADAIESSAVGVGQTDVQRRVLTEQDMIDAVRSEVAERHAAIQSLAGMNGIVKQRLRHEAALLLALVDGAEREPPDGDSPHVDQPPTGGSVGGCAQF